MTHELNDADEKILKRLGKGRNLPQNLADELGYSRQYIQNRLQMLKAADYVTNLGGGLYAITPEGLEKTGATAGQEQTIDVDRVAAGIDAALAALEGQSPDIDMATSELEGVMEEIDDG